MKTETIRENKLSRSEVDLISEEINDFLEKENTEKQDRIRIRYTMEDKILNVCETLGEDTPYTLTAGTMYRRKFIRFEYGGNPFDPCTSAEDPSENWSNRIMADMGLAPVWRYKNGLNLLELRSKRKQIGSIKQILLAIVIALAVGFLGYFFMPENIRENIAALFFEPLQGVFLNLLAIFAGIMIVLSVTCGIFNMGDMASFGKVGRRLFRRFIGITVLMAVIDAVVCYFVFPTVHAAGNSASMSAEGLSDIMSVLYNIVPTDPLTPFTTGNAMQIVLIGIILGVAILVFGERKDTVKNFFEESNSLVTNILTAICKFVPWYLFFVLTDMIWSGEFEAIGNVWKPFVVMVVIEFVMISVTILYVSIKFKVRFICIVKKLLPTFLPALSTASTLSVFSRTISDSTKKFGVDAKYVKMAHPIRSILYMPGLVTELMVVMFSMAAIYKVETSVSWVILGVFVIVVLTLATPPIPGSVVLILEILFTQMGIPSGAIAIAVTCDLFFDFLDTAVNNSMGIMEYILQADKMGMLDKEVLRKDGVNLIKDT